MSNFPRNIKVNPIPCCNGGGCEQGDYPERCDCKPTTELGAAGSPVPGISLRWFFICYVSFIAALIFWVVATW